MNKLTEQLKRHEGLRLKPYKCTAGKLTIGYGRNIEDCGITEDEATVMLNSDIAKCERQVSQNIKMRPDINDARYDVLVNMTFNMGLTGLLRFKKMLKAVKQGHYSLASVEMLDSKWAKQVPSRANELANQMRTGEYL